MDVQDEEVRLLLNRTRAARERLNAKMNANGKTSPLNQGLRYILKYNRQNYFFILFYTLKNCICYRCKGCPKPS